MYARTGLYFNSEEIDSYLEFAEGLSADLRLKECEEKDLVFLCIGTSRQIGDALGPLIGEALNKILTRNNIFNKKIYVYGDLHENVNAKNIRKKITEISKDHPNRITVAIDAGLGYEDSIGKYKLDEVKLKPGKGVHKYLPAVGDISITGFVEEKDNDEPLSYTDPERISLLYKCITKGIVHSLEEIYELKSPETYDLNCMTGNVPQMFATQYQENKGKMGLYKTEGLSTTDLYQILFSKDKVIREEIENLNNFREEFNLCPLEHQIWEDKINSMYEFLEF